MTDDYWVTKRNERADKRVVHTDRNCQVLGSAASVRPATDAQTEAASICDHCADTVDRSDQNWDAYRAATEATDD